MAFLDLTSGDSIRAVLGLDSTDLTDQNMTDMMMEEALVIAVVGIDHATIISEGTLGTPTSTQITKYNLLRLYATYYLASTVSSSQVTGMQSETDGKNAYKRFASTSWKNILESLGKMASYYRSLLEAELGTGSALQPAALASIASPDYDPVVGPNG